MPAVSMLQRARAAALAAAFVSAAVAAPAPAGSCGPSAPFSWAGKNVLWLGTSIPNQGAGRDSYPEIFCRLMDCRVTNNAVGGSHIRWDERSADPSCAAGRNDPKGLSATRRELREKIQAAQPDDGSRGYNPSCSPGLALDTMGYDARINEPWSRQRFDVVVIDHSRNDRPVGRGRDAPLGELDPQPLRIASIRTGPATTITLAPGHGLRPNDDITIRTPGIARMDYWTGEVAGVSGDSITIPLDSSGFNGAYAGGGTLVRYDKSRLYDAYNLVISDVLHMNAFHGGPPVLIVLMTSPTEWTGGRNDGSIATVNRAVAELGRRWGLPVYDMTSDLKIDAGNLRQYLPDTVHPTTPAAREFIASGIARWARSSRLVLDTCKGRWSGAAGAR